MTKPFFLPQGNSTRLCIHHVPTAQRGPTLGRIVFVHPFAEEMNNSRRMAAQQSRALASAGFEVLQIDLMGCGDSGGEFAEADSARPIGITPPGVPSRPQGTPVLTQPMHATGTLAHVMGMTAQNLPLIALTLPGADAPQILQMNFPATNLAPGSALIVTPHAGMTAPASSGAAPSVFELMSGFHWPALDEMLDIQAQSLQAATTQTLANILPNPAQAAKIPADILLFIAAVRSGDLNNWLGEKTIEALRRTGRSRNSSAG